LLRNVARLAEIPAGCAEPKEGRSLTIEQARLLLRAAEGDRHEALYLCGLMLGLRPGELCGLLWEDIDLEGATLQVRRSLKIERTGPRLGEPKTRRSYRGLDLPPAVVAALRAQRVRQAQERLFVGRAWVDHGLVFTSHVGTPVDPANLRRSFSALTTSAGLGHWTPKELRHSAASLLSAAGVPLDLHDIADGKTEPGRGDPAVVFCLDEFGPLNLLPRPGRQWAPTVSRSDKGSPGAPRRRRRRATHKRPHRVRHLMAALDLRTDKMYGHIKLNKNRTKFLGFCRYLRSLYPPQVRIAIVLDPLRSLDHRQAAMRVLDRTPEVLHRLDGNP
jgi:hypothetical protein